MHWKWLSWYLFCKKIKDSIPASVVLDARDDIHIDLKFALPGKERQDSVYSGLEVMYSSVVWIYLTWLYGNLSFVYIFPFSHELSQDESLIDEVTILSVAVLLFIWSSQVAYNCSLIYMTRIFLMFLKLRVAKYVILGGHFPEWLFWIKTYY